MLSKKLMKIGFCYGLVMLALAMVALMPRLALAADEIKIGAIASTTGKYITQGKNLMNGATMALKEINAAGGVDGRMITILFENDNSNTGQCQAITKKLIYRDNVMAILGPCGSSLIYAAQQVTEAAKIPLISHVGSTPKLTLEGQKYYFRNSISAVYQTKDLLRYAIDTLGYKRFGVAYDKGRTKSDADGFIKDLAEYDLEPVSVVAFQTNDVSFGPQILKLKAAEPEAIMVLGRQRQTAAFARQMKDAGLSAQIMGVTVVVYEEYIELGGDAVEGTLAPATFSMAMVPLDPRLKEFAVKYKENYGENPEHSSAQAYDAVYVLAEALKGLSFKPSDLADDRIKLKNNLEKIKNYKGFAGVVSYGPDDHDGYEHPSLLKVKQGQWTLLKEAE